MKSIFNKRTLSCVLAVAFILLQAVSLSACKKQKKTTDQLAEIAKEFQSKCPKDLGNGTTLETVYFDNNTMTYRMKMSDEAIATVNPANARDSIINNTNDRIKRALVKDGCNLKYEYISENDSIIITILPTELGEASAAVQKEEKTDK